ncbi:MAG: nuclear transport factor 2 family protein [Reyranella sp.]|uniref:nuclear transport factor 2 family protein n=1 Tax=Reyranella sp. TaxID=1929291 RepID=UPI003D12AC76
MRISRRHVAAAGALALATASLPSASRAESADEAAVTKAIDDLGKAMIAADKTKLDALVSDQLSYGHSSGRIETKAMFIDVFVSKKSVYKSIVLTEPKVAVVGNNAIARHVFAVDYESDGKPGSAKVGVMQVWVKEGGAWKLLARQAFRLAS